MRAPWVHYCNVCWSYQKEQDYYLQLHLFCHFYVWAITHVMPYSSEGVCFSGLQWPQWEWNSACQRECDAQPGNRFHALLNFWPFRQSVNNYIRPLFYLKLRGVESCLCLAVPLRLVWHWAVYLADCYLFCLLMIGLWLMDGVQDISDRQLLIALKSSAAVGA